MRCLSIATLCISSMKDKLKELGAEYSNLGSLSDNQYQISDRRPGKYPGQPKWEIKEYLYNSAGNLGSLDSDGSFQSKDAPRFSIRKGLPARQLESIEGKMKQFKAAFQSLSNTVVDSDLIKWFLDFGTGTLNVLNSIIDKVGSFSAIMGAIGAGLSFKNIGKPKMYGSVKYADSVCVLPDTAVFIQVC